MIVMNEGESLSVQKRQQRCWPYPMHPFLKWAGGKRWLIRNHSDLLPKQLRGNYFEPFLGSGALFFHLRPREATLSDKNGDLINAYVGIKSHRKAVQTYLEDHSFNHSNDYYYKIRSTTFSDIAERAAQFIYLNRTCFNGIYRVNCEGKFNVPVGSKNNVLLPGDDFIAWANMLSHATLRNVDFESCIDEASRGDFVFVDPPYTVRHNLNGFIKYNEVLFSWEDQERLAVALHRARRRGVRILMTNANHDSIRALYLKGFKLKVVSRFSSIAASSEKRNAFEELVITT